MGHPPRTLMSTRYGLPVVTPCGPDASVHSCQSKCVFFQLIACPFEKLVLLAPRWRGMGRQAMLVMLAMRCECRTACESRPRAPFLPSVSSVYRVG